MTVQMLTSRELREREATVLAPGSIGGPAPCWLRASGTHVWDLDGRELLDFTSGVLVLAAGHGHPRITAAIAAQAAELVNCYAAPHPLRSALAKELLRIAGDPFDRVLFLTTGSEAIDGALKLARFATGRTGVLTFEGSFHGRTLAGVSVGGLESLRTGIGTPLPHIVRAPYPYPYRWPHGQPVDETALKLARQAVEAADTEIGAVLIEPFLGAGGAVPATPSFLRQVRALADELGAVLILDEIQSGLGRCGAWFAFHELGFTPDIVVGSKGLGSGIPITAIISRAEIADLPGPGSLTSTFGGNPLACAAGLATLEVIEEEGLVANASRVHTALIDELRSWPGQVPLVGEARGAGLSLGIELVRDPQTKEPAAAEAQRVVELACEEGLVVLPPAGALGNVVRFAPALAISLEEALDGLQRLRRALERAAA